MRKPARTLTGPWLRVLLLVVLVLQKRYAQANSLLDLSLGTATMSIPVKVLKVRQRGQQQHARRDGRRTAARIRQCRCLTSGICERERSLGLLCGPSERWCAGTSSLTTGLSFRGLAMLLGVVVMVRWRR